MAQANLSVRIDENDIHINNNYLFTDLNEYQLQMEKVEKKTRNGKNDAERGRRLQS